MSWSKIQLKTIEDLEFPTVLQQVSERCHTDKGRERALSLLPFVDKTEAIVAMTQTAEYLDSFSNNNKIPNHGFESIDREVQILGIDQMVLDAPGFHRIAQLYDTWFQHHVFFKKMGNYFPLLSQLSATHLPCPELPEQIQSVFDRFGEIKDDASPSLRIIRLEMGLCRDKRNKSFSQAISHAVAQDYLDEIRESVVDNRRVLAVKAMHRRKIKGSALGMSKTGSIVFIEPESCMVHSRALSMLEIDEQEEIQRILAQLTERIRRFAPDLVRYQSFLAHMDVICAKARYAQLMDGVMPQIADRQELQFKKAYHPLLYLTNKKNNTPTHLQDIHLHDQNRIVVISGPNAGGKSITLKTIGLLQIMMQSGLLIPVHPATTLCFFDKILSDIGDNQSIENHLSTYSSRLKNMNEFLKKCNERTLFLIDEFGTGSDPELGGALAETFLEEFYQKGSYGVITTHYTNLKMLADELPFASNANMLFDAQSLSPTYQLVLGEAGSSFTFEVAQKNGIPYGLINRAKKKIEKGKVRFDATIAKLQQERSQVRAQDSLLKDQSNKAEQEAKRLTELNAKIKDKLVKYQQLYDANQRVLALGQKVEQLALQYFKDTKKRSLVSGLLQLVETENAKRKKQSTVVEKKEKQVLQEVQQEVIAQLPKVRAEKKKKQALAEKAPEKPMVDLQVGDRVRMFDGKAIGSIDAIEKNKATVNYGVFTTKVNLDQLEFVSRKK